MSSHRQIFKSTALIGGTQVINLGIGLVRNKALALLLGPVGVGLAGLYTVALSLVGSVAGLGINSSGVRQIAEAAGTGDEKRIACTVVTLRRVAFFSGIIGMIVVLALARVLSETTFGDHKHVFGIAAMSLTLLLNDISAGQFALLQGLRRLRDLAASQIVGTVFGAAVSIVLVWWLRERGIVPYLIAISGFTVLLSWLYAQRVQVRRVKVTWRETITHSRSLVGLGLAFTLSALIAAGGAYIIRILVQRQLGMAAVGIYTATWQLASYYVGFVLTAMGTDFMPRLTAAANTPVTMNRLVNEQSEMGMLIALPGVLATLTVAPWVLKFLLSSEFASGAAMARWQILGVFLRVVSWPLGYLLIAKGEAALFALTELAGGIIYVGLTYVCLRLWNLTGTGIAFAGLYVFYTVMMLALSWRLNGFRWSAAVMRIFGPAILTLGAVFLCTQFLPQPWSLCIGSLATVVCGVISLRVLEKMLGVGLWRTFCRKMQSQRS